MEKYYKLWVGLGLAVIVIVAVGLGIRAHKHSSEQAQNNPSPAETSNQQDLGPSSGTPVYQAMPQTTAGGSQTTGGTQASQNQTPASKPNYQTPKIVGLVDGVATTTNLFKLSGDPTVYALIDGQLRPFVSAAAFEARGFHFSQVKTVSLNDLAKFVVGGALNIPDGSIVKAPNSQAYIVFNGQKNIAAPPSLVSHLGLSLSNTIAISDTGLAALPDGPPVNY